MSAAVAARNAPAWVAPYIGLPFDDHGRGPEVFDCWGLVRWVLARQFGIRDLPDHGGYAHANHQPSVGATFHEGLAAAWHRLEQGVAAAGDIVVFSRAAKADHAVIRVPFHVGLVVAPGTMLHIEMRCAAVIERYDGPHWGHRIEGVYRHVTKL